LISSAASGDVFAWARAKIPTTALSASGSAMGRYFKSERRAEGAAGAIRPDPFHNYAPAMIRAPREIPDEARPPPALHKNNARPAGHLRSHHAVEEHNIGLFNWGFVQGARRRICRGIWQKP